MRFRNCLLLAAALPALSAAQAHPGCAPLQAGDFKVSTFTVGSRPISVDFLTHPDGSFDSYFTRMTGQIVKVDAKGAQSTVATLPGESMTYAGMTAFQFHPDFRDNGWAFSLRLIKTPGWTGAANLGAYTVRLSRHRFAPATGQLTEEKVLLDIPQISVKNMGGSSSYNRARDDVGTYAYFQNGQMRFDRHGNLYLNLGADHRSHESYVFTHDPKYIASSAEARAANTRKLNGSILRIFPDSSARGYRIPAGNFREHWERYFQERGNAEAAREYSLAAGKVAPEIYVKGTRTNWTLKTHRKRDWLVWGEVMVTGAYDEISIVKQPAFGGYPYFYGNNEKTFRYYIGHYEDRVVDESGYDRTQNASLNPASRADTNAPKNLSPLNDGAVHLPPAFNPQITSQRYQSRRGGVRLGDAGLPYASNGTPGSAQAAGDSWFEASAGEKSQTAMPPVATNQTRYQAIMAGDVYAFDRTLANPRKFPPHFDDHLFIFDWEQNVADAAKVSDLGDRIVVDTVINVKSLLGLGSISKIIDGTFTPAGTLFLSSELGTVYHVEYTGSCVEIGPTSARPERTSPWESPVHAAGPRARRIPPWALPPVAARQPRPLPGRPRGHPAGLPRLHGPVPEPAAGTVVLPPDGLPREARRGAGLRALIPATGAALPPRPAAPSGAIPRGIPGAAVTRSAEAPRGSPSARPSRPIFLPMPLPGPAGLPSRALPAPPTPAAPQGLPGGRPEISAPKDPVRLAPGPNQLAGVLDQAPARLKAEMLHLQNRPGAFHEGAQPTRIIHGKEVTISAPILGMKLPKEAGPAAGSGALPSLSLLPHKEAGQEGAQEIPLKPSGGALVTRPHSGPPAEEPVHAKPSPPGQPPAKPLPAPPQPQGPLRPQPLPATQASSSAGKPARPHPEEGNLPDTPAGTEGSKKGMGWGKKALIGVAALIGLSFLIPQDSSSSADGKGSNPAT